MLRQSLGNDVGSSRRRRGRGAPLQARQTRQARAGHLEVRAKTHPATAQEDAKEVDDDNIINAFLASCGGAGEDTESEWDEERINNYEATYWPWSSALPAANLWNSSDQLKQQRRQNYQPAASESELADVVSASAGGTLQDFPCDLTALPLDVEDIALLRKCTGEYGGLHAFAICMRALWQQWGWRFRAWRRDEQLDEVLRWTLGAEEHGGLRDYNVGQHGLGGDPLPAVESVSEGHPRKLSAQTSDAVLDAGLTEGTMGRVSEAALVSRVAKDPKSQLACEDVLSRDTTGKDHPNKFCAQAPC